MKQQQFEICQIGLVIQSQLPLEDREEDALFRREISCPDLTIFCEAAEELPLEGDFLGQHGDQMIYRQGDRILRYSTAGQRPYAMLSYRLADRTAAKLLIKRDDWPWVTRGLHFWLTACFPTLLLHFQTLLFHASYIDWNGKGILFTAPSQTGKSTQAELWRRYRGAQVLNGDKAAVRLETPTMAHSVPFSGTSGICENRSLPLEAIVVLSQAPENTIRRLSPTEAVTALCPNVFVDQMVAEEWSMAMNLLLDLVATVPVYALACTPDERAVETLEQAMNK